MVANTPNASSLDVAELSGKTLGLIGFGRIGKEIVEIITKSML